MAVTKQIQSFIPLVEFLGSVMGDHCEVVLHDVRDIENSIVEIKNSHISHRKVGGSLTDLALSILKNKSYLEKDFLLNYAGKTQEGKIVRSSTFFIKDENGEVMGMLCLNMDVSKIIETRNLLDILINGAIEIPSNGLHLHGKSPEDETNPIEDFHTSIEELTTSIIMKTLSEAGIPSDRMSTDEKMEVIQKLNERGVFLIKGAVSEVATQLKSSEATIYRYLQKLT
ncbi:MAG TPA: PAS domain-containing protein [Pseudoneobacillus sp.]|nr:PAS domain-containing protein [Pseudoneobacillus sp.]